MDRPEGPRDPGGARTALEALDRESLVLRAQAAGIRRARILTRPELVDELLRLDPSIDEATLRRSRGFFGRARDLLSRVIERGLHLPDAADRLRTTLNTNVPDVPRPEPEAIPTVTLAEIYAAQGHHTRAVETLEKVLEREPEHGAARAMLDRLRSSEYVSPQPALPPEAEVEQEPSLPSEPAPPPEEAPREPECVALPSSSGRAYVWWRVDPARVGPTIVVRVLVLTPTWDGPVERIRDISCDPATGEIVVEDLPERAVVRVAIGSLAGDSFVPIAHSPALETAAPRERGLVRWTLDGVVPVVLDDPRARSIVRALEGARRALATFGGVSAS